MLHESPSLRTLDFQDCVNFIRFVDLLKATIAMKTDDCAFLAPFILSSRIANILALCLEWEASTLAVWF